ncbi:hypothetical protein LX97_00429 [Nonlabens dokdonensis]|uniref:Uncharacterized protein n=2 Tax=Nonlabens dokdonensis TaxID=328515 RepID=L7W6I7_NONDD|nr:hypothetical protein [Nonlabens dokdonensis]AGC75744.1 hypothetical protein DDD_0617 [Nonlabens dokdonensis DSW-6]PZX43429.1 hypothetical protein LX97_00429 [Nonlabens dokdonensis]
MTKKITICVLAFLAFGLFAKSQNLGELKSKVANSGQNPKKKASKEVYISNFNVLVEIYREDTDYKAKREFRGKGRGEAKANAALGLSGVDAIKLQEKVDQLYKELVADLESKGFTILEADAVKDTKFYKKAIPLNGPVLRESANPGMLEIIPTNFKGYASVKDAEGTSSKKSGLFSGFKAVGKAVSGGNNALSKEINDAIVLDINLVMSWSETGGSWLKSLGGANARIKTNLTLGSKAITAPKKKGIRFKGAEDVYNLETDFNLSQGSGLRKTVWKGYLKKPLTIEGVIEDTKVESYNRGEASQSYDVGNIYTVTYWESTISENAKMVAVDPDKFANALYLSGKTFIDDQLNYMFEKYSKVK